MKEKEKLEELTAAAKLYIPSTLNIELLNNKLHELSPPGGFVSPSGGFASLSFHQVLPKISQPHLAN